MHTITRIYTKRETSKSDWSGNVGEVELTLGDDGTMTLDGTKLGDAAVRHLLNFALQTLQDAYAGAKSFDEAQGNFAKKRAALLEGTIGVRGNGESEATKVARKLVLTEFKLGLGTGWKDSEKWKAFDALSVEEQNAKLDAAFEKNEAHFAPKVKAEIARLEKARKAKAAIFADARMIEL